MEIDEKAPQDTVEVDASWANAAHRKSTSGGIVRLQGFILSWWSRTQAVIAQSTCEAELPALNVGACEGRYVQQIMGEMDMKAIITMLGGSQTAVRTTAKKGPGRMRHLDIKELWLQGEVREGRIRIMHVPGDSYPAGIPTKQLVHKKLVQLTALVGLRSGSEL